MFKINKLTNGLELISAPLSGTKTVTALVIFGTGSRYETKKNNGISHFLEHIVFKGTKKRPNTLAIAGELDGIGGEYNAFTSKEMTGFWVKVEASQLELAMDVLSDIILNSLMPSKEIEREKGVIIEEANMYLDNPLIHIDDLFEQCLYGDTPIGWTTIGSKENINGFKRDDFVDYFHSQYRVSNAIICLSGKIPANSIVLTENFFQKMAKGQAKDCSIVVSQQKQPEIKLFYKKTDQAHLSLGVPSYPSGHPLETALKILAVLLGGTMSSRLFIKLRERSGLAYYVKTQSECYTDSGYLTTCAGVPLAKVDIAIKIILEEYQKLVTSIVAKDELVRVKQCIIGRTALQLEESDSMASWYAQQAITFKQQKVSKKILSPNDYYEKIRQVSAEEIMKVAKEIFVNNKLNLAVIGPYKDKKIFKDILRFN
ncbi:MAG: pitrilysin family protein [bacterium]|nr:pitrilysin family protein [bacterium]